MEAGANASSRAAAFEGAVENVPERHFNLRSDFICSGIRFRVSYTSSFPA